MGLAHADVQGEMLQSLWRHASGCCGRAGSCDVEGVVAEAGPWSQWVVPPETRLLDGGTSEGQGQPLMSAPAIVNVTIAHVGEVIAHFGE